MCSHWALLRLLSWGYWRRHRVRAVLLLLCIGVGIATWTATQALRHHLDVASRQAAAPLGGDADLYLSNGEVGLSSRLVHQVRGVSGIERLRTLVLQRGQLAGPDPLPVLLIGIDRKESQEELGRKQLDVTLTSAGELLLASRRGQIPALVGEQLAARLRGHAFSIRVGGSPVEFIAAGTIRAQAGAAAMLGGPVVVLERAELARLVGQAEEVSRIDVFLERTADPTLVRQRIGELLQGRGQIAMAGGGETAGHDTLQGVKTALSLGGFGSLVLGFFLICSTLAVSLEDRRSLFGLLHALGATRGQIAGLLLAEALGFGVLGSGVGLPLGYGLAVFSCQPVQRILSEIFLPLPELTFTLAPGTLAGGLLAGLFSMVVGMGMPLRQILRRTPLDVIRLEPPAADSGRPRLGLAVSTVFLFAGLLLNTTVRERWASLASLSCLAAGGLFLAPWLALGLGLLLRRPARRALGVCGWLALETFLRWPGRNGLVTAALAASAALLLQAASLIRSNERAVRHWVDLSVAGDLFVTSGGPLSASGQVAPMDPGVGREIQERWPDWHLVPLRFRWVDWSQGPAHERVLLMLLDAGRYVEAYGKRSVPLPEVDLYRELAAYPDGALVSTNFAALYGIRRGDKLTIPGRDGPVSFRVLGSVTDYSCSRGTVLVDRRRYASAFAAEEVDVLSVQVPEGLDIAELRRQLVQTPMAVQHALCVLTHGEVRGHINGMIQRLYALAYAQEVVVQAVSVLGIVMTLLISVLQRRREFALLRMLGATRWQVVSSVLVESLWLGGLGAVVGLLLGLGLTWFTIRVVLFRETGFLFPLAVPWTAPLVVLLVGLATATVAALGPAWTVARGRVTDGL
jgi:putative ABC transport system permease protein